MRMGPLDLKLLIIFDAVMTERSITRAARRIGMSQPALSNALARLRDVLNDRLFIRGPDGMRPTPRALELAVPVAQSLRQLQAAFDQRTFVPAEAERTFRLSMSPHASTVILPPLLERLQRTAPRVRIRVVAKNNTRLVPMLDSNEIDFVIGSFIDLPKRFSSVELFRDEFVCVMRRNHPMSQGELSLDRFIAAHHVLITATGEEGSLFDDVLRDLGYVRPISLIVNEYLAGLLVIARTDLITGLFSRIFHIGESFRELSLQSLPLPIAPLSIRLAWHPALRNDPAYVWLRDELVAVSGEIAGYERQDQGRATK